MRSFTEACCERIVSRLLALVERSKAARTSNGRELVVVKDAAIKAYMKEHDIHLRTCSGYSPSPLTQRPQPPAAAPAIAHRSAVPVTGAAGVLRIARSRQ